MNVSNVPEQNSNNSIVPNDHYRAFVFYFWFCDLA